MVENRPRKRREQPAFLRRREPAPGAVESAPRRLDRSIDIRSGPCGDRRKRLSVRGIDHRQRRPGRRRNPAVADEVRGRCRHRRQRNGSVHCPTARPELPGQCVLIHARHVADAIACCPQVDLEVQRDDSRVVDRELGRSLQVGLPLHVVDGLQRILGQRIDLRVGIAAAIRGAVALVAVVRHQQRLQRRRRLAGARAPAHQHEAELELRRLREERRRRHRDDLGVDADAAQHLRDRLRDLRVVDVAVVGRVDREPEAVRIASLRQQLLRAFGVVGLDLQILRRAEQEVGDELPGWNRLAFHHLVDDRRPVDRLGDRLAHARILERILGERLAGLVGDERRHVAVAVQVEIDEAVSDGAVDAEALVLLELRHVRRRHVLDRLDVAGQQRCDARSILRQEAQRHFFPGRRAAPVRVVSRELDAVAFDIADELVGTGADGRLAAVEILGRGFRRRLRDHHHLRHVGRHQRIRRGRLEADRIRIDDDDFLDLLGERGERRRAVGHRRDALDRRDDVGRGEVAAVMELDAVAQLELPGQRVDRLPLGSEAGLELRLLVALDEVAEDVRGDVVVRRDVVVVRVERGHVGAESDGQGRRRRGMRRRAERQREDRGGA